MASLPMGRTRPMEGQKVKDEGLALKWRRQRRARTGNPLTLFQLHSLNCCLILYCDSGMAKLSSSSSSASFDSFPIAETCAG